jgi:hypothetical protein
MIRVEPDNREAVAYVPTENARALIPYLGQLGTWAYIGPHKFGMAYVDPDAGKLIACNSHMLAWCDVAAVERARVLSDDLEALPGGVAMAPLPGASVWVPFPDWRLMLEGARPTRIYIPRDALLAALDTFADVNPEGPAGIEIADEGGVLTLQNGDEIRPEPSGFVEGGAIATLELDRDYLRRIALDCGPIVCIEHGGKYKPVTIATTFGGVVLQPIGLRKKP